MTDTILRSTDYHDYVIKDSKLIGAFEEMYRNCPNPWHQDDPEVYWPGEDIALLLLSKREYSRVLDVGCGKGRFTNRVYQLTGANVTAIDISPTAIESARSRYPKIDFQTVNVPPLPFPDGHFDLIVSAELLWYILPSLQSFFAEVKRVLVGGGGHYLIIQQFYQPGEQKYGNDVMETPQDLIRLLPFDVSQYIDVNPLSNHKAILLLQA